jgi:hypothetical protein
MAIGRSGETSTTPGIARSFVMVSSAAAPVMLPTSVRTRPTKNPAVSRSLAMSEIDRSDDVVTIQPLRSRIVSSRVPGV